MPKKESHGSAKSASKGCSSGRASPQQNETQQAHDQQVVFQSCKMLGEGLQSKVYMAKRIGTEEESKKHQEYCLKVFEPFKDTTDKYNAQNECKVANSVVGHPHIIEISEFKHESVIIDGVRDQRSFAILEYCKNGDLYEYMTTYLGAQSDSEFKGMMANDKTLLRSLME